MLLIVLISHNPFVTKVQNTKYMRLFTPTVHRSFKQKVFLTKLWVMKCQHINYVIVAQNIALAVPIQNVERIRCL